VSGGSCSSLADLPPDALAVVQESRRAVLTTVDEQGRPHAVPVCFAIVEGSICSALDHKPKSGKTLARVRNVRANPVSSLLFDRWDENWERLAWVMVRGWASLAPPGTGRAELVSRYPQYQVTPPEGEVIVIRPERLTFWSYA
jgi:PPOX class probable F420-dependent enzyme